MRVKIAPAILLFIALLSAQSVPLQPVFSDETERSGIRFHLNGNPTPDKYLIETMCGGAAVLDYNNDGWLDIFLMNGGSFQVNAGLGSIDRSAPANWNRLYRNNRDGTFTDVTSEAGLAAPSSRVFGMGVAAGDYDNDGWTDLYITNFGDNILYRNNGNGSFSDVTATARVAAGGWSVTAGFLDYDNDGRLDLFVGRYLDWDFNKHVYCGSGNTHTYCPPSKHKPMPNVLYRNNGDGTFSDVSAASRVAAVPGTAMGLSFNDFDGNGFPDIFVSNDGRPHFLYRNEGRGKFTEEALDLGVAYNENGITVSGMGVAFNDYNNDGLPDIAVTDLASELYELFLNAGRGGFKSVSRLSGLASISANRSGWGVRFVDYDNDGWKDLFISQSHVIDNVEMFNPNLAYHLPPLLLRNVRSRFEDVSLISGPIFKEPFAGRGIAVGDLNNDGAMDVVVNVLNGPARILFNRASGLPNQWLLVRLQGNSSNRDGQGATLILESASGLKQWQYASTCGSYLASHDPRVHFGLGNGQGPFRLEVRWPGGTRQILENVQPNRILSVVEPPRQEAKN